MENATVDNFNIYSHHWKDFTADEAEVFSVTDYSKDIHSLKKKGNGLVSRYIFRRIITGYDRNSGGFVVNYDTCYLFSFDRENLSFEGESVSEIKTAEVENWKTIYYVHTNELKVVRSNTEDYLYTVYSTEPLAYEGVASRLASNHSFPPILRKVDALPDLKIYEWFGHYYSLITDKKSWLDAERYCEDIGGHLITDNLGFPYRYYWTVSGIDWYKSFSSTWIGAYRGNKDARITTGPGDFYWVDGTKVEELKKAAWHYNEPNNTGNVENAVQFAIMDNQWGTAKEWALNDTKQEDLCNFVCQWDDPANFGKRISGYTYEMVSNGEDFIKAAKAGLKEIHLAKDIYLDDSFEGLDAYSNVIDGQGHTIYVSPRSIDSDKKINFINTLNGTVKNVTFDIEISTDDEFTGLGGIINENKGTLSNVTVKGTIEAPQVSRLGGVVGLNNGVLDNVKSEVNITGKDNIGGIAGMISTGGTYTKLTNDGVIDGKKAVGGIAGYVAHSAAMNVEELTNNSEITGVSNVGGIFGLMNIDGNVVFAGEKLTNEGTINGVDNVGGIIGRGTAGNKTSHIDNAYNSSSINASYYAGAIAGCLKNIILNSPSNDGSTLLIEDCGLDGDANKISYVGGIAGYAYAIDNAVNEISIIAEGRYVGGIAGYVTGTISNCENKGDITCNSDYAGGIAGYTTGFAGSQELKNEGDIIGKKYVGGVYGYHAYSQESAYTATYKNLSNKGSVLGTDYVGGIMGYSNNKTTKNGVATVKVEANTNTGDVTGKTYIGGLYGYIYSNDATNSYFMDSSSKNATVTGETVYIGGLVGEIANITMDNCSNEGMTILVTSVGMDSDLKPISYVGGYAGKGYAFKNISNSVVVSAPGNYVGGIVGYSNGVISDCKNDGNVSSNNNYVGGISGCNNGAYSFANLTNEGDITGKEYVGGIFGSSYSRYAGAYTAPYSKLSNSGDISGVNYVGGIAGYIYHDATNYNANALVQLSRFTNTGTVTASSEEPIVGGVLGYAYADANTSFITVSSTTGTIDKYGQLVNIVDKDA